MTEVRPDGWISPTERRDGLTVQTVGSDWGIFARDGRLLCDACPCCDKRLPDAGRARLLCDNLYPLPEGTIQ
ncbi:MAG TPA: hypothetical protein VK741_25705 [Acetobacteraceae bacterium]|nr:hypothetical protein [Acetobacteraceae bacterium]